MKFHDTLNEKLWNKVEGKEEYTLKEEVKDKLNEIADAFIDSLEINDDAITDIVITGSCASYNYTKYSDVDLHLIVDFEKVHEDCPIVEGYLLSKKAEFNSKHDIFIYGIPVELYAEGVDNTNVHNGLYSLKQEKWIDIPKQLEPTDNDAAVEAKYNEFVELSNDVHDADVAKDLIDKIRTMRKSGLEKGGEFSTENLTFKRLRDTGVIGKLMDIRKEGIDKQLSLESYNESADTQPVIKLMNKLYGTDKVGCKKGQYNLLVGGPNAEKVEGWGAKVVLELSGKGATKDEVVGKDLKDLADKLQKLIDNKQPVNEWVKADWHILLKDDEKTYTFTSRDEAEKFFNSNKSKVAKYYMQSLDDNGDVVFKRDLYAERLDETLTDYKYDDEISVFEKGSEGYEILEKAAKELSEKLGIDVKVETTWFDWGQKWQWTTLIAEDKNGVIFSDGSAWQLIYPPQQKELLYGDYDKGIKDICNSYLPRMKKNECLECGSAKEQNDKLLKLDRLVNTINKELRIKSEDSYELEVYRIEQSTNVYGTLILTLYKGDTECGKARLIGDVLIGDDIEGKLNELATNSITEDLETKSYKGAKYTILPDGDYADIRIYAPEGKSFKNGDTFYTTQVKLSDVDKKAEDIIDGEFSINESMSLDDIKELFIVNNGNTASHTRKIADELQKLPKGTILRYNLGNSYNEVCEYVRDHSSLGWHWYLIADGRVINNGEKDSFAVANDLKNTILENDKIPYEILELDKLAIAQVESVDKQQGIYNPYLILQAYNKEKKWLKEIGVGEGEKAPEIMLFIIEGKEIKGTKLVKRADVYTYKPDSNEYYLDMTRDSGDVITDFNLEPAQQLVDRWNSSSPLDIISTNESEVEPNGFNNPLEDKEEDIEDNIGNWLDYFGMETISTVPKAKFKKDNYTVTYEQDAFPVPILTLYKDNKILKQLQVFKTSDSDRLFEYLRNTMDDKNESIGAENKSSQESDEKESIVIIGSKDYISSKLRNAGFNNIKIETYTGSHRKYDGALITADDDTITSLAMWLDENNYKYYSLNELTERSSIKEENRGLYIAFLEQPFVKEHLINSIEAQLAENTEAKVGDTVIDSDRLISLFQDKLNPEDYKDFNVDRAEEYLFDELHKLELRKGFKPMGMEESVNYGIKYYYVIEDLNARGDRLDTAEEAYEQAKSDLGDSFEVKELTDDLEFSVVGKLSGVAYDGVIYTVDSLKEDENKPKRYKMDINAVLDYIVGDMVDIVDYTLNGDKFTIIYDEGDGERQVTKSTKQLEKMLGVSDLVWKYDDNGSLDRISYIREAIQEDVNTLCDKVDAVSDDITDLIKSLSQPMSTSESLNVLIDKALGE